MLKINSNLKFTTEFFLLLIGFIFLLINNYLYAIPASTQMAILLSLVFIVGVPHGALDFLVDEQNEMLKNKIFSLKNFLVVYLTRLFMFALLWFFPIIAFSVFLVFSIFHFGETDMVAFVKPNKFAVVLYCAYGSLIFSLLLLSHLTEMEETLPAAGILLKKIGFYFFLIKYSNHIIILFGLIFLISLFVQYKKGFLKNITIFKVVQMLFLFFVIKLLPLTLAFTFYFALWHSILSVRNIFNYFKNNNNKEKLQIIGTKSVLFSLLALISIIGLYFIMRHFNPSFDILTALLIILSVLTLPHLTVMHGMYKNYSKSFN